MHDRPFRSDSSGSVVRQRMALSTFARGASHAPDHVAQEWADKYEEQFDEGWDALREATLARQKTLGVIPEDARQMEVYAGF